MQSSESATLPRSFRFHYQDGQCPRTPEPLPQGEPQPPSPPRAQRLRVKRRNVSQLSGPTEQFLASVAAADIPLPTIEVPRVDEDEHMFDRSATPLPNMSFLTPRFAEHGASPPRTPLPQLLISMDEGLHQRRDWYLNSASSARNTMHRPSSSLSDLSDCSDDSYFSESRVSRPSEDGSCTSPDSDIVDPFVFGSKLQGRDAASMGEATSANPTVVLNGQMRSKTRNDAPWSKEMSEHLWQIYQIYLQDPTVTPFRIGASAVPPEGVVHRVAREARRSWKGPKHATRHLAKRHASCSNLDSRTSMEKAGSPDTTTTSNSGSITPTGDVAPKAYLQWQHSSAATRNHLRDLCRRKHSASMQKYRHLQSRSPTPFTQARPRRRDVFRSSVPTPHNTFSTEDIALSLATSASQSMQPDGPLAQLTELSRSANIANPKPWQEKDNSILGNPFLQEAQPRRLGSPFAARTYGPSSSSTFGSMSHPSPPRGVPDTRSTTGPSLRSPLRLNHVRSLNGTQKRRAQHPLEDELSPNGAVIRPSILDEQLFGGPLDNLQRRVRSRGFSLGDAALGNRVPGLFQTQKDGVNDISEIGVATSGSSNGSRPVTPLLPSVEFHQVRLGSPFAESGSSNTFPRRLLQPMDGTTTIRKRAFATVHHTRRSIESFDFGDGPSLRSRLSRLDQKLAEIRDREAAISK